MNGSLGLTRCKYKLVLLWTLLFFSYGCVSVPQKEFKSYTDVFAETKAVTEQFLLEYDQAKRIETEAKSAKPPKINKSSPYPADLKIIVMAQNRTSVDAVGARREALEVVSSFNAILISLAEGKKPEEIKSITDSFLEDLNGVANLFGDQFAIPYVGQIGSLISTVVTKLQEAQNRQQFVAALKEAEPIIQGIVLLFAKDAEDIYQIRAKQADRQWTDSQDKVATLVRQIKNVAKGYATPGGSYTPRLVKIEKEVRNVLDRVGLKENSEALSMTGPAIFEELTLSQFDQTLVQANLEADRYEIAIKQQVAFHKLIVSYGELLGKTTTSLTAVRLALDAPSDIRQQSKELFSFVFTVKRNWEELDSVRRTATVK